MDGLSSGPRLGRSPSRIVRELEKTIQKGGLFELQKKAERTRPKATNLYSHAELTPTPITSGKPPIILLLIFPAHINTPSSAEPPRSAPSL